MKDNNPPFRWANRIEIEHCDEGFRVCGRSFEAPHKQGSDRDLLSEYLKNVASGNKQKAPHFLFANAGAREDQLAFVKRFGPICVEPDSLRRIPSLDGPHRFDVEVIQNIETLRREQRLFGSIFALYEQVHSRDARPESIFNLARTIQAGTADWVRQCALQEEDAKRIDDNIDDDGAAIPARRWWSEMPWRWNAERQAQLAMWVEDLGGRSYAHDTNILEHAAVVEALTLRIREGDQPTTATFKVKKPPVDKKTLARCVHHGHMVLCEIFNAFPLNLTRLHGVTSELPGQDLLLGIRHILYYLLRLDYLRKSRIAQCAWKDCQTWFKVGSRESPCCTAEHALKHRQWKYHHEGKGKQIRAARYRKAKQKQSETSKRKRKAGKS